jgi:hypothetical protein
VPISRATPGAATPFDGRNLGRAAFIITGPVIDGAKPGPYAMLKARHIDTTPTVLTHNLGRTPTGYHMVRSHQGGVVFDEDPDESAWSGTSVTLRATVAGTYSILVF